MSLPRYPNYQSSGTAWLEEIPATWRVMPLIRVASVNDEVLPESTPPSFEIEYVDIGSVSLEKGIERTEQFIFADAPSRARRLVRDGDVLVSTVRTYLKAIAPVANPPENLVVSTGFAVVRPSEELCSRYAKYALQATGFVDEVISRSTGVSYPAINASDLVRIAVPIPPSGEQTAIATFLDRETGKIDALIAEQEKLLALLAEKRQATISHAVTKGLNPDAPMKDSGVAWLGEVPGHWETIRLGALFREVSEPGNEELPVLSVSIHDGVSDKELDEKEMDRKVTRSDDRSKYKAVGPGDLTYNMMRAWQGGFGSVLVEGMVSPAYVVARPVREFSTSLIEQQLRTPKAVTEMKRHSRGITDFRLRLYWEEFKTICVALPPKSEQDEILSFIESESFWLNALADEANRSIALLKERRSALIAAAVTGQIDVRGLITEPEAA